MQFFIRGKNPRDAVARAYIDANVDAEFRDFAWMIAKHEGRDGKRLHTHAYTHLLSEEERRNCPPQNKYLLKKGQQTFDNWQGEMQDKYGFMPPKDFRDQVSWLFFHHLERLPCVEFPE